MNENEWAQLLLRANIVTKYIYILGTCWVFHWTFTIKQLENSVLSIVVFVKITKDERPLLFYFHNEAIWTVQSLLINKKKEPHLNLEALFFSMFQLTCIQEIGERDADQ